jgi:hypothetical protein
LRKKEHFWEWRVRNKDSISGRNTGICNIERKPAWLKWKSKSTTRREEVRVGTDLVMKHMVSLVKEYFLFSSSEHR